ncbi:histidine kinase dimerization/phospho-acceptor domain-containing protein [Luteithermobacter gelatinilyticus]|uniref:sensor histidine kinase n=1 Tax=Luteithermobacter gelatinilyticus TaxID=2582913 RepID=UPI001107136D|nr:histidine kinase dimerization/phospho-acceptor domain-containing protein [Luteithermobacter gelatinilyticus]
MRFNKTFLPIAITICFACAAIIGSLFFTYYSIRDLTRSNHQHMVRLYLENLHSEIQAIALDNSVWDEAYQKITLEGDQFWIDNTYGTSEFLGGRLHGIALIRQDQSRFQQFTYKGHDGYKLPADFRETRLDDFIRQIKRPNVRANKPQLFYDTLRGNPVLFSLHPIVPHADMSLLSASPDTWDLMLFWKIFTPGELKLISDRLKLGNLYVTQTPQENSFPLPGLDGTALGYLSWTGDDIPVRSMSLPVTISLGMFLILGLASTISYFRVADLVRNLDSARQDAEKDHRIKSEFLATMSHELRTPLNSIIGFSEVLDTEILGKLNPRQKEYVGYVITSGNHLLSLINDILDMSKIEAGKYDLYEEEVDLCELIEQCHILMQNMAGEKHIRMETVFPDPPPLIKADLRAMKQILLNLLSNALNYTPVGGGLLLG